MAPEIHAPRTSRHSAHESGKRCKLYAPTAFTPLEIHLVLISVRSRVDPTAIVMPEGLNQQKMQRPHRESNSQHSAFYGIAAKTAPPNTRFETVMSEVFSRSRITKQRSWLLHQSVAL